MAPVGEVISVSLPWFDREDCWGGVGLYLLRHRRTRMLPSRMFCPSLRWHRWL